MIKLSFNNDYINALRFAFHLKYSYYLFYLLTGTFNLIYDA